MSGLHCPAHSRAAGVAGRVGDAVAGLVFDQLTRLQRVAAGEPLPAAEVARIRADMREGVLIWRRLLAAHRPVDDRNRCPACPRTLLRRARWPCRVWQIAYAELIADPRERAAATGGPRRRRRTGPSHSGPGSTSPPRSGPRGSTAPKRPAGPAGAPPSPDVRGWGGGRS